MESLTELYRIGRGPSSSHTIGPERACRYFLNNNPCADKFCAVLYGSLAKTGEGHGTERIIRESFYPVLCEVIRNTDEDNIPHPNTMELIAYKNGKKIDSIKVMSVGGGKIRIENHEGFKTKEAGYFNSFFKTVEYCREKNIRLWEYALMIEEDGFWEYMNDVWQTMKRCIESGLSAEGILPGGLGVRRKAKQLYQSGDKNVFQSHENRYICAYAYAVGEQNASAETIVTAPTCGAAGVVPSVLYYQQKSRNYSDEQIIKALITAGIIGNLIKTNASISGAECGCQAEIGSACAMASAALCELFGFDFEQTECAAEIAIEHNLGLTCDPVCGLVQIPCIERNAVAAMQAMNAICIAGILSDMRKISFDKAVETMKQTGMDLPRQYRETAEGGLARFYDN